MIKVLVMDVDGTLTDGKLYYGSEGEVFKIFNIKDGYGINDLCKKHKIITAIITGRKSIIVEKRAKELSVDYVFQGIKNKNDVLNQLCKDLEVDLSNFAYIGDDLNDESCIDLINDNNGITGCPFDALESIKAKVKYCCVNSGGNGAVREFIDYFLKKN